MTGTVYDLTDRMARKERLDSAELKSCWAGNELRVHLDALTEQFETVCRRRELVMAERLKATAAKAKKLGRLLDAIEALKQLASETQDEIWQIERPYDERYDELDGQAIALAEELETERHRIRCIAQLGERVVKIAGEK